MRTTQFAVVFVVCLMAQTQKLIGQTTAALKLSSEVVQAGSPFVVDVSLSPTQSFDGYVEVHFIHDPDGFQLWAVEHVKADQVSTSIPVNVPVDATAGNYKLLFVNFGASFRRILKVDPISVTVTGPALPIRTPSSVVATLNPTQKQFLETKGAELEPILDRFSAQLDVNASDEPQVRSAAARLVEEADKQLLTAEKEYVLIAGDNLSRSPVFFDDFHRQYLELLSDLKLTPGLKAKGARLPVTYIPASFQSTASGEQTRSATSYAPVLMLVLNSIKNNLAAYRRIEQTGSDRFSMTIRSVPSGATISYKRLGSDYVDLSKTTDVVNEKFDLAMWTFKIQKDKCFVIRHPDPYNESNLDFEVKLDCAKHN